ncbi:MAG: hypothetical protein HKP05_01070 [Woeseiaceae bacterium]|nr:hypothetical protein [Gammaproteobacteria bacterium]NNK24215.1 hypothetical protein [Woeseiaceae bacterium]
MAAARSFSLALLPGLVLTANVALGAVPLFASEDVIEAAIDAPLTTLMDVRPDEAQLKGSFAWTEADGTEKRIEVKLRTRGNYRRAKHHCDFAPIRLNFRKSEVAGTEFDGQDKLKLVTHCMTLEPDFQPIILREYLAYRLFRELTDVGYGVRLLNIRYFDTESEDEYTRYGFVIEDDKEMAQRHDLKIAKQRSFSHGDHDRVRQNLVHVFQFMIGNTEYSLVNPEPDKGCCHNVDVLSDDKGLGHIAVPFDFDFSGLVDAPYAEPNPRYPIRIVRNRYYKGLCANNDLLPATLDLFHERRKAIFSAIKELRSLRGPGVTAARSARRYIREFYKILDDPEAVELNLVAQCRTPGESNDVEP